MISVGIIGGTGFTGQKLIKFCSFHPYIKSVNVYSGNSAGKYFNDLYPELQGVIGNLEIKSAENLTFEDDLYFTALPHGIAMEFVPSILDHGKSVIDLGGDYRLDDSADYKEWYNLLHSSPELLNDKFYGLADLYKSEKQIKLISNPGCYPTAVLTGLIPFVKHFGSKIESVAINAYSGTSGAGKAPKAELQFYEMNENVRAYGVTQHRHTPEIQQELNKVYKIPDVTFIPHIMPVKSGIYTTSVIKLSDSIEQKELADIYNNEFDESNFVRVRNNPPELNWVVDTNFCDLYVSAKNNTVVIISAIDNLIKGASGQAVQNMNNLFGLEEHTGILNSVSGGEAYV